MRLLFQKDFPQINQMVVHQTSDVFFEVVLNNAFDVKIVSTPGNNDARFLFFLQFFDFLQHLSQCDFHGARVHFHGVL